MKTNQFRICLRTDKLTHQFLLGGDLLDTGFFHECLSCFQDFFFFFNHVTEVLHQEKWFFYLPKDVTATPLSEA